MPAITTVLSALEFGVFDTLLIRQLPVIYDSGIHY
jgi:hypothetical protein